MASKSRTIYKLWMVWPGLVSYHNTPRMGPNIWAKKISLQKVDFRCSEMQVKTPSFQTNWANSRLLRNQTRLLQLQLELAKKFWMNFRHPQTLIKLLLAVKLTCRWSKSHCWDCKEQLTTLLASLIMLQGIVLLPLRTLLVMKPMWWDRHRKLSEGLFIIHP